MKERFDVPACLLLPPEIIRRRREVLALFCILMLCRLLTAAAAPERGAGSGLEGKSQKEKGKRPGKEDFGLRTLDPGPGTVIAGRDLCAAVVCAEARGEGLIGQAAVWEVIHRRSLERGLSAERVVRQRRQFACLNRVTPDRLVLRMRSQPEWPAVSALVASAPRTRYTCGANHFTRCDENPPWARGHRPVAMIGAHAFYKL